MAVDITNENFKTVIEQGTKPVVVDAYAAWCGPCQQMAPVFDQLEKEFGDHYTFAKLNVDEARDLSIQLGITSVPTFIFFKNGKVVGRETGYMSKEDMQDLLQNLF